MCNRGVFQGPAIDWRKIATPEAEGASLLFPALTGAPGL